MHAFRSPPAGRQGEPRPYLQPINKEAIKFTIYGNESGRRHAGIMVDQIDFSRGWGGERRRGGRGRRVKFTQAHVQRGDLGGEQ